ncbi:MAG: hypothetical protein AAFX99_36050, partial [Myxococcota bacterium]
MSDTTPLSAATPQGRPSPGRLWGEVLGAAVLATVLLGIGFGSGAMLFDNDSLYADVARTMVTTGDWLNPQIHGVPFLDKPPLFFWILGVLMAIPDDSISSIRLTANL